MWNGTRHKRFWLFLALAFALLIWLWWNGHVGGGDTHALPAWRDDVASARELLIDLRDDATPDAMAALAQRFGLTLRPNTAIEEPTNRLERAALPTGADVAKLLLDLRADPLVEAVEPDLQYEAFAEPFQP